LVVGCCAFDLQVPLASTTDPTPKSKIENPKSKIPPLPCLWKLLRRVASKSRCKRGKRIHINDSKIVFSQNTGLKELEKSVLTLLAASTDLPPDLPAALQQLAGQLELDDYRWYARPLDERFPIEQDSTSIRLLANVVKAEMERTQTRCVHLSARVILEGKLNQMFEETRNKSSVLFSQ